MAVAIELILVFLAFCWVAGQAMPADESIVPPAWALPAMIFFVPAYVGLLALKITPVGRKIKRSRVFMGFLTLFAFVAFGVGALAFYVLSNPVTSIGSSQLFRFFVDPLPLRLFWSGVIGVAVGIEVLAVLLIPIGYLVARGKYGDFEQYKTNKREATRTAIYGFLGLSKGTWEVRDGKLEVMDKPDGSLARFGGPGELIVQQGHAVVLERDGRVSGVVASGAHWLKPFERLAMVVPLYVRGEQVKVSQLLTKDGVLIDEMEIFVWHRVDPSPEKDQVIDGEYRFSPQTMQNRVWSPGKTDWRDAIQAVTDRMAREVCGRYPLEHFAPLTEERRIAFIQALMVEIQKVATKLAVIITVVDVGRVRIPQETQARLIEKWVANWQYDVLNRQAETEKDIQIKRAQGRMQTIQAISAGLKLATGEGAKPKDLVALEFIDHLERQANGEGSDTDAIIRLQGLATLKALESAP